VSINPIVDIRPRLLQRPIVQLAQVHTDQPAYWRLVTDDTFDGSQWRPSNPTAANGTTPTGGVVTNSLPTLPCANPSSDPTLLLQFPKTCPAGYPDDGPRILAIHQQFTFGPLAEPYLPAAASPVRIDVSSGAVRYDPAAQTLVYPDATYRGFRYNVTSVVVVPTPAELNTVTYQAMAEQDASRYTFLPANMPPEIAQIAQQWTVGATTPYQKIMAIQSHLLKFTYDQHVQFAASSNDLLYFLRVAHRGFCEQFAGAMAVLLRSIGIPARVAVGFTPGSPIPTNLGTWSVTTANAHAWVEVLFPNYGWLQFEPTPGRNNPVASPYDAPATVPLGPQTSCARFNKHNICIDSGRGGIGGSGRNRGNSTRYESKLTHELRNTVGQPLPGFRVQPEPLSSRARAWAVRVGLLLLAGLAIGIPAYKLARRRAILRHGRRPDDRVLAAYRALLADASDLGWGRRPSETPREYRDRLTANAPFHNGDLDRLTTLADRAAYGHGVAPDEARQAVVSAKRVTRDLRKATPPLRRMAGLFRIDRS
jgi:hypothetical protein